MAFANVFLHRDPTPLAVPGVAFTDGEMEHVSPDADAEFLCGETVTLVAQMTSGANLPDCGAVFEVFETGGGLIHAGYAPFVAGVATYVIPAGVVCPYDGFTPRGYEWRAGIEIAGVRCAYSSKRGFGVTYINWSGMAATLQITAASWDAFWDYVEAQCPDLQRVEGAPTLSKADLYGYYSTGIAYEHYDALAELWLPQELTIELIPQDCFWFAGDWLSMYPWQWCCGTPASGFKFVPFSTSYPFAFVLDLWCPAGRPPNFNESNDKSAWLEIA